MRRLRFALTACLLLSASSAGAFVWPNAAERVEKELGSSDVGARRKAAQRLGQLPESVARRLVLVALEDPDAEVRLSASGVALELHVAAAGERVVSWLSDPDRRVRLAAAELLVHAPTKRAVGALGRALSDPDAGVRSAAAEALGASEQPDATMPLLGHLDDATPAVRRAVVNALSRLGDARAVVPLIGKIQDSRPNVRRAVAVALGELGDRRATSALLLALRDPDEIVRVGALEALGRLRDAQATLAVSALVEDDPRSPVRAAALDALARIGSKEALDVLVGALSGDEDGSGNGAARRALASMGSAAVPRLRKCLTGQPAPAVADGCALALGDIGAKAAVPTLVDALRRGVVRPRAVLEALGAIKEPKSLPTVLEHLEDSDPLVRVDAIDATAALLDPQTPDGRAVEPIARALDKARGHSGESVALIRLLGRTGSKRAAKVLAPLAEAADAEALRVAALEALGFIPGANMDKVLIEALGADEASVRLAAAIALRRTASGASARALLDRLEQAAEQDRTALALALSGALARDESTADVDRVERLVLGSRGAERDALLEALAQAPGKGTLERLSRFVAREASVEDRAKVAEAIAARKDAAPLLEQLAKDADGAVRANAVWALGNVGGSADKALLVAALSDRDVAVASNAAAALGRLARRTKANVKKELCARLLDSRSALRASSLDGLVVAGVRCDGGIARRLLEGDRSELVRTRAARLVSRVTGKDAAKDRALLERCAAEDHSGSVAAACSREPEPLPTGSEPVSVVVVPLGEAAAVPRAPFALVLADGTTRYGLTDCRGQVLEVAAPRGEVSLAVPAPLLR